MWYAVNHGMYVIVDYLLGLDRKRGDKRKLYLYLHHKQEMKLFLV